MLTTANTFNYGSTALDASSVSIDVLLFTSVQALTRSAFFVPALWWAVWELLRGRRPLVNGNVNPVQSAALLIDVKGGSSQLYEDLPMCKKISTQPSENNVSITDDKANQDQEKKQQIQELEYRIKRLLRRFDPLSEEFNDVLSISRVLRGRHRLGFEVKGYVALLEKPPTPPKREVFV